MVVDAVLGRKRTNGTNELLEGVKGALETEAKVKEVAAQYKDRSDFYFVARGYQSPVALEDALKLKELSYIHTEGMRERAEARHPGSDREGDASGGDQPFGGLSRRRPLQR
jgi:glucosamine 6-phosphate synthetase-like amidotransferase/phosphosugar isomerase protein